jgi:hypothetical protein
MLDQLFNGIDAVHVTGRLGMTVITAVTVGWGHVQGAMHERAIIRLGHLARTADAQSAERCAMVGTTPPDNFEPFREPGEILILPGNFDSLRGIGGHLRHCVEGGPVQHEGTHRTHIV